tara:strand:+ start:787 stop:2199 length:1413 start_codon:yes stop_codon:yes gene_type:complete
MLDSIKIKSPTVVNLEITEICNVKCKHCYNPWRDESMGVNQLDLIKIEKILKHLHQIGVFHVILSGGEPMSNFKILKEAMKILNKYKMTFSCNTNLIIADDEKMRELKDLGLEHCLTSIPSIDEKENDEIMQSKGSLKKILNGIKSCIKNGVRVSANMVVTKSNLERVYETGKKMAELGCSKFFVTRAVPPVYSEVSKANNEKENELVLSHLDVKKSLDEALRVKKDYGIAIGSLISYPLCFLGDLQKYSDFVGRGCPSQRGHVINVNADGKIHTCVHEEESYGSIWSSDFKDVYKKKMLKWRDGSMHYSECKSCPYLQVCNSGCQMTANAVNGKPASKDPLFVGKEGITKDIDIITDNRIYDYIHDLGDFYVPERIRFRDDGEICIVNVRWGNSMTINAKLGRYLEKAQKDKSKFNIKQFGVDRVDTLANLFFKNIIESQEDLGIDIIKIGLSLDLSHSPVTSNSLNKF